MAFAQERLYTVEDIYALPEGKRAELIDGRIYDMAPPNAVHQRISSGLHGTIYSYIKTKKGACEIFAAPFAVFLNKDSHNYVEPDISVVCDRNKINEKGCNGAPDWVIEIVSPSTRHMDYGIKLFKYCTAGVREYWVVNPKTRMVNVFDFEHDRESDMYGFEDCIPVCIFEELRIRVADFISVGNEGKGHAGVDI